MGAFRRLAEALKVRGRRLAGLFAGKAGRGGVEAPRRGIAASGSERAQPADEEWIEVEDGSGEASAKGAPAARMGDLRPLFASRAFVLGLVVASGALVTAIAVSALLSRPLPVMPPLAEGVDLELFSSFRYPDSPLPYAGMEAITPPGTLPSERPEGPSPEARILAELARKGRAEVDDFLEAVE